jgi:acetyl-CoA carboxylase biotin carboxyl carrier protein
MKLTYDDVHEILQLLDAGPFNELHLRTMRFDLRLRRDGDGEWAATAQDMSTPNLVQADAAAAVAHAAAHATPAPGAAAGAEHLTDVRTPILGTFYRAAKPGVPPFVEIGSLVDKDTVVGIVETMKLMTSVYAEAKGRIVEIHYKDAAFVEQDAVLMRIEPESK